MVLIVVFAATTITLAQSKTLAIGEVQLQLGTPKESVIKALGKYQVMPLPSGSYVVTQHNEVTKIDELFGSVRFDDKGQLSSISQQIDTSEWPKDEGYSVARAITDALASSIPTTDSDGSKSATVKIVTSNSVKTAGGVQINLRTLLIYVNDRKITVAIMDDGRKQRDINITMTIQTLPW